MRTNRLSISTKLLILAVIVVPCFGGASAQSPEPDPSKYNRDYEATSAKARTECAALWGDHVFDAIRDKIPLGEEKPTFSMLTNSERLRGKDKPLADSAIKTLERCRAAYAPAFAMLPPQINAMIQGLQRKQDALIAELYVGKITFGQFNVAMNRMNGEILGALSGIRQSPETPPPPPAGKVVKRTAESQAQASESRPREDSSDRKAVNKATKTRLALVIGNSNYSNLSRLTNPANDARALSNVLSNMGFTTRLVLDASEQTLRKEVRNFASQSNKVDIALAFYAGHGAQVNGENYLLPTDIDIPKTESDIQLTGLKVDDLVNSMQSNTKVVFLDACRDNPALFKNLVKGRGSYATGLRPLMHPILREEVPVAASLSHMPLIPDLLL